MTRRGFAFILFALIVGGLAGCDDPAAPEADADTDGDGDGDGDSDGDSDADGDGPCVPVTCLDIDRACGAYDDGCGETIECLRGCRCTVETFAEACPERACETVVGCEEGLYVYEAVSCGGGRVRVSRRGV